MLKLKLQSFGHRRVDSLEKTLMLGEIGAGGKEDNRGWDGWMASSTQWTWVWVDSGSWWWTGRPGVLRFLGSQRVGHDWATELNWTELNGETGTLLHCWWKFKLIQSLWIIWIIISVIEHFSCAFGRLYAFFGEVSIEIWCPLFDWAVWFFILTFLSCLYYFGALVASFASIFSHGGYFSFGLWFPLLWKSFEFN